MKNIIGTKIKDLREQHMLDIEDIIDEVSMGGRNRRQDAGRLKKVEEGKRELTVREARDIAEFFGLSPDYFLKFLTEISIGDEDCNEDHYTRRDIAEMFEISDSDLQLVSNKIYSFKNKYPNKVDKISKNGSGKNYINAIKKEYID